MTQGINDILASFGALLPSELILEGSLDSDGSLALPAEREYSARMVKSRADEFLTGRSCARRALRRLGHPDAELLPRPNRAPAWPDRVRGSISHTAGICIAAVGDAERYFGVGIDVERRLAVTEKLERYVATPTEIERYDGHDDWRTIAFSCKESLFKCLNPPTGIWLEFREVELLEIGESTFRARVSPKDEAEFDLVGQYVFSDAYVLSAVVLGAGWSRI